MNEFDVLDVAKADAVKRALRTLAQGLAATVLVAVVSTVYEAVFAGDVEWNGAYWAKIGIMAGSAAVTAAVSYLHRRFGSDPTVL
jgi:hypothetical protein